MNILPIRCHTCSTVLSYKPIIEIIDKTVASPVTKSVQVLISEFEKIIPISHCCKIKFINYIQTYEQK